MSMINPPFVPGKRHWGRYISDADAEMAISLGLTFPGMSCADVERAISRRKKLRRPTRQQMREAAIGKKPDACGVCHRSVKIVFDHCHVTGRARGWLCSPCNTALGMVGDNPDRLLALAQYLRD